MSISLECEKSLGLPNSNSEIFKVRHLTLVRGDAQDLDAITNSISLYVSSIADPKKVRTAKAERRTFGRFFFRFPNGEAGLDVYNRVSSFLATLSRDLHQFHDAGADLSNLNILIVTHGLTLRLLLMRYFQLSVDEFEQSWNSQNAKLVVMDRIIPEGDESGTLLGGADPFKDVNLDSSQPSSLEGPRKPFFRLDEAAKEALNLRGDVSSEKPIFFRSDSFLDPKMPHDSEA